MNLETITVSAASQWARWLWDLLFLVWTVLWVGMKRAKKLESPGQMLQHVVPLILGFWLLFGKSVTGWNFLEIELLPEIPLLLWSGLVLTAVGVALAIWARVTLGANWSGGVTLKKDHELIHTGLYRWIRHPIYTGMLAAFFGTAMVICRMRGFLGFLILWAAFYGKARREERFLLEEFGDGFREHTKHTGMFLPRFR
jgi:protein-S-isoprenylcysteine O-methyltransferase Ste14